MKKKGAEEQRSRGATSHMVEDERNFEERETRPSIGDCSGSSPFLFSSKKNNDAAVSTE